ncbi:MAG: hypothetical protein HC853_10685, partial [Anaerolineae bacterium]|nr:hypothetical protein [Anaerolineae bacterium]
RLIANIPGSVRIPPSRVYQAISSADAVGGGDGGGVGGEVKLGGYWLLVIGY